MAATRRIRRILTHLACLLLLVRAARGQAEQQIPRDDSQVWSDVQVSLPLEQKVSLLFGGALRLGRDFSHIVYTRADGGIAFDVTKFMTVSPLYYFIAFHRFPGEDLREHRVLLDTTLHFSFGLFRISDRNRFERRFLETERVFRYRNRLQLEHPWELGALRLRLFVSDEISYDGSANAWVRNRFILGASKDLTREFSVNLFYLRQNDGHSRPGDVHGLGISLQIHI